MTCALSSVPRGICRNWATFGSTTGGGRALCGFDPGEGRGVPRADGCDAGDGRYLGVVDGCDPADDLAGADTCRTGAGGGGGAPEKTSGRDVGGLNLEG
jgi:hypothetical protein